VILETVILETVILETVILETVILETVILETVILETSDPRNVESERHSTAIPPARRPFHCYFGPAWERFQSDDQWLVLRK